MVGLTGLTRLGDRQSWYGVAEIRGGTAVRSSMAHAASLGTVVAGSGACRAWPDLTFRLAITAAGDALVVTAAERGQQPAATSQTAPAHAQGGAGNPGRRGGSRASAAGHAAARDRTIGRFYQGLDQLARILGGPRLLRDCAGDDGWPEHGVYFFFETGEARADGGCRVVRVGTHALTASSRTTLWGRLRQHRGHLAGSQPGGGNHRASVFRRHVGAAIIRREKLPGGLLSSWLDKNGPAAGWADEEARLEQKVSEHIGAMPFLWLSVPDRADRGYVEANAIALTSRLAQGLDAPGARWLGNHAYRTEIVQSGLWNVEHVRDHCDPAFPGRFEQLVERSR